MVHLSFCAMLPFNRKIDNGNGYKGVGRCLEVVTGSIWLFLLVLSDASDTGCECVVRVPKCVLCRGRSSSAADARPSCQNQAVARWCCSARSYLIEPFSPLLLPLADGVLLQALLFPIITSLRHRWKRQSALTGPGSCHCLRPRPPLSI